VLDSLAGILDGAGQYLVAGHEGDIDTNQGRPNKLVDLLLDTYAHMGI